MTIGEQYIAAKYGNWTRDDLLALRNRVGDEIAEIKRAKDDVFTRFPGVHGRFQNSQLDILDIREMKACGVFDNLSSMIAQARH